VRVQPLLTVSAVLESVVGLALLTSSSVPVLLLGAPLDTIPAVIVSRVAGAALVSLGVACWLSRHGTLSSASHGVIVALLIYNVLTAGLLAHAGLSLELRGVALWPAVAIHVALAIWSAACVRRSTP
jgi:hypothetical protein